MNNIARISNKDREALFRNTARKIGLNEAIVEKDFWVCWALDYLFHKCKWKDNLAFKGGTSLSKGYGLIERFSEDIDLILDWRVLGYTIDEPWLERSNTKQDAFNKEVNKKVEDFLKNEFLELIKGDFSEELKMAAQIKIDDEDGQTLKFIYPQSFYDGSILQEIRLEIGALAAWTPVVELELRPYAAEEYLALFIQPTTHVRTVASKRTFWEKLTILHREANRPSGGIPSRYSRHYYDIYCMGSSKVKEKAFLDIELLKEVVLFKDKFYRSSWAKYNEACPGTIKLLPPEQSWSALSDDYLHMQNMIFGDKPSFEEIMKGIKKLEDEINSL